jgi:two-component system phosphate regulon sensor histidine kinase PhoR
MKRSLWWALAMRFAAGAVVLLAVCWLTASLPARAIAGLGIAMTVAFWCRRMLLDALEPMTLALRSAGQEPRLPQPCFSELEDLAASCDRAADRARQRLKHAENNHAGMESILNSMQDAVVAVDAAGRIQWTNEPMRHLLPGIPASSAVRVGHALVQTIRDPEVLACVEDALRERHPAERRATTVAPGRTFAVNAAPMPHGGAVAVLREITRLEQVERTQRDFVANVSHELRTPLTSITGYAETLLDDVEEDTLDPDSARARVDSGEKPLRLAQVKASALVRESLEAVAGVLRDSEAQLSLGDVVDTEVVADTDGIVRVLGNLIENALRYGNEPGGARIVVSAEDDCSEAGAVRFSVRDFGMGIPSEHLPRLFERFYRVDKARSRESGGTGLGLAIARRLVESQGGRIWCESELNKGSVFSFTLPCSMAAGEPVWPGGTTDDTEVLAAGQAKFTF